MDAGAPPLIKSEPARLRLDPLPALLAGQDGALAHWVGRDLLGESVPGPESLWQRAEVVRLVHKQQPDGSWK